MEIMDNDMTKVTCNFHDCFKCCLETEMILTQDDLQLIENQGFDRKDFCLTRAQADGFWQLKNVNGRCFFLSKAGRCSIYEFRPKGCRFYPLIVDLELNQVVVDDDCRETKWFAQQSYHRIQINDIELLVETLLKENPDY